MGPEDILDNDILPNLPCSAGYQHNITIFSRYFFAYPTQNMTAQTVGKCIIDVMTRHVYLPTTIISDKGSQFTAEMVQEITKILNIEIRHATTKHAQTIGILERTHASIKITLKISSKEINVAQISTNRSHESQYNISRNHRLRTINCLPWSLSLQCTRP